ncbi:MAG: YraN family protein [Nitrospirae bacterium]|nr:YraN family protein [Nitrospirota bacterium]
MRKKMGKEGERFAARFLKKNGYRILACNYRTALGEIDIIAKDGNQIVFIEVKTRKGDTCIAPEESVNWQKQQRIKRLALLYLKKHKLHDIPVRFDVIGLRVKEGYYVVEHIKDAFAF